MTRHHKSRADRKSKRERASRAKERGLPEAPAEPILPARAAPTRRRTALPGQVRSTRSAWVGVLIGAILALGVVFVVAQSRKASVMSGAPPASEQGPASTGTTAASADSHAP